jgi:hypothetical protein
MLARRKRGAADKMKFDQSVYEENLRLLLDEFHQQLCDGTKNAGDFISMNEIERITSEAIHNSNTLYLELLSSFLSNIDEADLILKKN